MNDAGCSSGSNDAPAYDSSDLMAHPNPKSPKPNLYHDSYVQEVKDSLNADIEDYAVMNDFVTESTTLVVVEVTWRSRPVDEVVMKKRRSREKQHKLKECFSEFGEDSSQKKSNGWRPWSRLFHKQVTSFSWKHNHFIFAEIDAGGDLKNMERPPESYADFEISS